MHSLLLNGNLQNAMLVPSCCDEKLQHGDWLKGFKYLEASTHEAGARENGF
jgi:hypothetical protein